MKTFQIDFVRAVLHNEICRANAENPTRYFGGEDISILSFYEELLDPQQVDRFVKTYNQLISQSNKEQRIGAGIVSTNETPTITNLRDSYSSPFEWTCKISTALANRDKMIDTLNHVIKAKKGRKVDIAVIHFENKELLLPVETFEQDFENGVFIGQVSTFSSANISAKINSLLAQLMGATYTPNNGDFLYFENGTNALCKCVYDETRGWELDNDFFPNNTFEKFKVDMSFDAIEVRQPYTLNATEHCDFILSGSATLVNEAIRLGNDLVRIYIAKDKIITSESGSADFLFRDGSGNKIYYDVEPMEMPSNLGTSTIANNLRSNFFLEKSHTEKVKSAIQYTFIMDFAIDLLVQWFNYARYYETNLGVNSAIQNSSITPNIIYEVVEIFNSWGKIDKHTFKTKIVDEISVDNTESDIMTIAVPMQLQGDNN